MIRIGLDLSEADWASGVWAYTVINSNSPRSMDVPMAQGVIDFARAGQMSIITPFCLAGAMAPVTVAGALVLQHAEALGGIVLAQMTKAGAPVSYGGFSSNVDLKSGAPAFGTPEHLKMQLGLGPTGAAHRPALAVGQRVRPRTRPTCRRRRKPPIRCGVRCWRRPH